MQKTHSLNSKQSLILNLVNKGESVFYSGHAGTGKSYLLRKIIANLRQTHFTEVGVTSSTGISAVNIGGTTLHSYFKIGTGESPIEDLIARNRKNTNWLHTKALIVDEISMIDAALFDKLEQMARELRNNDEPFGGMQLVFVGDFYQLPPVKNDARYCFEADSWKRCMKNSILLNTIYRQTNSKFVSMLNEIRNNKASDETIKLLQRQSSLNICEKDGIKCTKLYSRNKQVDQLNGVELSKLPGKERTFTGELSGESSLKKFLLQNSRAPLNLPLKVGAQVMLLKNIDPSEGLVNGLKGIVTELEDEDQAPFVKFENGRNMFVKAQDWTISDPVDKKKTATYSQIPLNLAWACTIHKSQGQTISKLEVDCSGIFTYGQLYVALSRAQDLNNLKIMNFQRKHIKTDPRVSEFYKKVKNNETTETNFLEIHGALQDFAEEKIESPSLKKPTFFQMQKIRLREEREAMSSNSQSVTENRSDKSKQIKKPRAKKVKLQSQNREIIDLSNISKVPNENFNNMGTSYPDEISIISSRPANGKRSVLIQHISQKRKSTSESPQLTKKIRESGAQIYLKQE
eukprot:NODE_150_length_15491_cov_0.365644.p3 type:complete len:573 gc:universal NODE_150_length_15491_cov_0.365644:8864-10582(+)